MHPVKLSFITEGGIKTFHNKQTNKKKFITTKLALVEDI
jgi:hypothetical protein